MALSTSQLRNAWAPACKLQRPTTVNLFGEGRVHVDGRIVAALDALNGCLRAYGYRTRRADTGAYNCRKITGGSGYSLHAYGIAVDINWQSNPYGKRLITDMPAGMVGAITALRTGNGKQVWRWGGFYATNKDAMHYEIVCTPADLATGIDGRTGATKPEQRGGFPTRVVRRGEKGQDVVAIQYGLNLMRRYTQRIPLTVDGSYGPTTASVVGSFQQFARAMQQLAGERRERELVAVDGTWGPITARAAEFWAGIK